MKFKFKLQQVLEFREHREEQAKLEYLRCHSMRLEGELGIRRIQDRRSECLQTTVERVDQMVTLENYLSRLDDDERAQEIVVDVLKQDEQAAFQRWVTARQEAEALRVLHDKALDEFTMLEARREQNELDDFAVMRRRIG